MLKAVGSCSNPMAKRFQGYTPEKKKPTVILLRTKLNITYINSTTVFTEDCSKIQPTPVCQPHSMLKGQIPQKCNKSLLTCILCLLSLQGPG